MSSLTVIILTKNEEKNIKIENFGENSKKYYDENFSKKIFFEKLIKCLY